MQCARPTAKSIYKLILILKNNSARSVRLRNDLQIKAAGLGSGPTRPILCTQIRQTATASLLFLDKYLSIPPAALPPRGAIQLFIYFTFNTFLMRGKPFLAYIATHLALDLFPPETDTDTRT